MFPIDTNDYAYKQTNDVVNNFTASLKEFNRQHKIISQDDVKLNELITIPTEGAPALLLFICSYNLSICFKRILQTLNTSIEFNLNIVKTIKEIKNTFQREISDTEQQITYIQEILRHVNNNKQLDHNRTNFQLLILFYNLFRDLNELNF